MANIHVSHQLDPVTVPPARAPVCAAVALIIIFWDVTRSAAVSSLSPPLRRMVPAFLFIVLTTIGQDKIPRKHDWELLRLIQGR
jgi:hypothetical protein